MLASLGEFPSHVRTLSRKCRVRSNAYDESGVNLNCSTPDLDGCSHVDEGKSQAECIDGELNSMPGKADYLGICRIAVD